jgi:hypothetical protein
VKIFLQKKSLKWTHNKSESLHWGSNQTYLPPFNSSDIYTSFKMKCANRKVGPIVGILTASHPKKPFSGNRTLFASIQKKIQSSGGLVFVFTPEDFFLEHVTGYVFSFELKKWIKSSFPLPDVVYNRFPFRKSEKEENVQRVFDHLNDRSIPFFNPHFFNKFDLYSLFKSDQYLKNFLPHTTLLTSKKKLLDALKNYNNVYLKPIEGSQGNGIFTITKNRSNIKIKTQMTEETFESFHTCWIKILQLTKSKVYVIQQGISLKKYLGKHFDLRVHAHHSDSLWSITGVGVRAAKLNGITTNLPQGGVIISEKRVRPLIQKKLLRKLIENIGDKLTKEYGLIKEFSADIGVSENGEYFIFEVNAKPMIFDEVNIQQNRINKLTEAFYDLSNFK